MFGVPNHGSISPAQAQTLLAGGAQLIDVRNPAEFAAHRVEGALNLPLGELSHRISEVRDANDIVLLCRSGHRSGLAADQLKAHGLTRVCEVEGGILAWERAGLPTHKMRVAWDLERQVRFFAGTLVTIFCLAGTFVARPFFFGALAIGAALTLTSALGICPMMSALRLLPWNRIRS